MKVNKRSKQTLRNGKIFLSVVLPPEIYDRVNLEAKAADRSKSKYVELLLRETFHELDVKRQIAAVQP